MQLVDLTIHQSNKILKYRFHHGILGWISLTSDSCMCIKWAPLWLTCPLQQEVKYTWHISFKETLHGSSLIFFLEITFLNIRSISVYYINIIPQRFLRTTDLKFSAVKCLFTKHSSKMFFRFGIGQKLRFSKLEVEVETFPIFSSGWLNIYIVVQYSRFSENLPTICYCNRKALP